MKKFKYALSAVAMLASTTALAGQFTVYGKVVGVHPVTGFENVSSVETRCFDERVEVPGSRNSTDQIFTTVTGAVIGGVLGNVVSKGNKGATIAGAGVGGILGAHHGGSRGSSHTETQRTCRDVTVNNRRQTIQYYEIDYEWQGYSGMFTTMSPDYRLGQPITLTIDIRRF